jgi:hypothetical protein
MGGQQASKTTQNYSPEAERLLRTRTDLASGLTPDVTRMFQGVLKGGAAADAVVNPYVKSAAAPYYAATDQAAEQLMRNTPTGGRQSAALADLYMKGGLQRAQETSQLRNQWMQNLMQAALNVYGMAPAPTGTTATQKPGVSFGMGPFQATL